MKKILAGAAILAAAYLGVGQEESRGPATQGSIKTSQVTISNGHKYTISKETTLVDGPRNADGTINYVQAYNAYISKGVTADNNAAVLLLRVTQTPEARSTLLPLLEELNVPPGVEKELIRTLDSYAAKTGHPPKDEELAAMEKAVREIPWKSGEHPLAAEWLEVCEPGAKLLDEASRRTRMYLPFSSDHTPPTMSDGLPFYGGLRTAVVLMAARAAHRAGEGDMRGALEDMGRLRAFVRLTRQLRLAITNLIGVAYDTIALHALQAMILEGQMSEGDLNAARKMIESLPAYTDGDDDQSQGEQLYALDIVMQLMRGDGGKFLSYGAGDYTGKAVINRGDLDGADWDAMMKEMGQAVARERLESRKPLLERLKRADRLLEDEKKDMRPASSLFAEEDEPQGIGSLEAYLKRREKESNVEFSQRIGRWLEMPGAGMAKRFVFLESGYQLNYEICKVLIALQQYRLAHGSYPEALKDLGVPVLQDPIVGKDIHYRTESEGFVVWGVGENMKDDGATGDDMVYRGHAKR